MLPSHTHTVGGSDLQPSDSIAGAVHWSQLTGIKNKHQRVQPMTNTAIKHKVLHIETALFFNLCINF